MFNEVLYKPTICKLNQKYSYQYFNTKAIFLAMELKNLSPKKSFVTLSLNLFKVLE